MRIPDPHPFPVCPPPCGAHRVEHWRRWRADLAHDWHWTVQGLRERGLDDEWITEQRRHYRRWLIAMIDEALTEADALSEWAA